MNQIFLSLMMALPASVSVSAETPPNQVLLESQAWQAQVACNAKISKSISTDDKLFESYKCFSQSIDMVTKDMDLKK